jgi:DNA-binding NarL/FixJ family response regulator
MSKSQRLRSQELRRVYQLVGECRELGQDALAWHRHMLEGLTRLVGAAVSTSMELQPGADGQLGGVFGVDAGWATASQRAFYFEQYVAGDGFRGAVTFQRFTAVRSRHLTRSRQQVVPTTEWDRSFEFNETRRPLGLDDLLASVVWLQDPPALYGFVLNRPLGEPPFGPRECRLAHLLLQELARHLGRALARQPGGLFVALPVRLQQTLRCLLEGDSEEQAALRLGLSRCTLHEYVSDLYRHFEVNSRAEMLARCYRHCGPLRPGAEGRSAANLLPRLLPTLRCLLDGASEKEAAVRLGLSRHTVHEYAVELYRRLGVTTRAELIVRCHGLPPNAAKEKLLTQAPPLTGRSALG